MYNLQQVRDNNHFGLLIGDVFVDKSSQST